MVGRDPTLIMGLLSPKRMGEFKKKGMNEQMTECFILFFFLSLKKKTFNFH